MNKLKEKKQQLEATLAAINVHTKVTPQQAAKIDELKQRLQFRLMKLEEQGLDEKISIFNQVLKALNE